MEVLPAIQCDILGIVAVRLVEYLYMVVIVVTGDHEIAVNEAEEFVSIERPDRVIAHSVRKPFGVNTVGHLVIAVVIVGVQIVLQVGQRRSGLVVDCLLGQQEIVVKSFPALRGMLPVFSGATVLSGGRPALILDAGGLV